MATLNGKIDQAELVYKETLTRLIMLEEKIKAKKFPKDKETEFMTEIAEVRKRLADHEAHIRHLKTHSRRLFVLMAIFMGVCCALFMIYVLAFGPPSSETTKVDPVDSISDNN